MYMYFPQGMSLFLKNTTFHGILLDAFFYSDSPTKRGIVELVNEGIANGAVRPLPATVFDKQQVEQAFRFMATGKHIGKVLLKVRSEEPTKEVKPSTNLVAAIPKTYMNSDKSYILAGKLLNSFISFGSLTNQPKTQHNLFRIYLKHIMSWKVLLENNF